jgi:epoxyqueuosine reductase QueG
MDEQQFREWISEEIERFVREDPGNRLERLDGSPIFQPPLVGFVSGSDPIFRKIKEVIGEFYMTPLEAVEKIAEGRGVTAPREDRIGIVSFILPISNETRRENAKLKDAPSERWAHTRLFGEQFNKKLQQQLVSVVAQKGYFVAAPEMEEKLFRMLVDEKVGWASTWSQRHVAFAANLGTFGLSDGLITRAGKAHRVGSIIVDQPLESPQRTDDIHRDCLFYRDGSCKKCIERCPADAISEQGHDKQTCAAFVLSQAGLIKERYGIDIYGCGLCQTGVSCERRIPAKAD